MARGSAGVLLTVAMVAALLAVPAVTGAPPAAAVGDVNLLFSASGDPARYGANEVVLIEAGNINFVGDCTATAGRLTPGLPDHFQPFADLYIVPAGSTFTNNATLVDAYGAPNTVFGGGAGSFLNEPLGLTFPTGRISTGVYGVVVDECQNGVWDTGEDTLVDNAFRVVVQEDVPPLSPSAQAFIDLKGRASTLDSAMTGIEQLLRLKEIIEKLRTAQSIATASTSPEAFGAFVVNQAVAAIEANSPYNKAKEHLQTVIRDTAVQHVTRYRRLAADPPDPAFQQLVLPSATGAHADDSSLEFAEAFNAYMTQMDALSALTGGIVDAVEKYQGADAEGNAQWAVRHARTVQELSALYESRIPAVQDATDVMEAALDQITIEWGFDFAASIRQIEGQLDNLYLLGYDTNVGFGNTGQDKDIAVPIVDELNDVMGGAFPDLATDWKARFVAAEADLVDFAAALPAFAALVGDLETELSATLGDRDRDPTLAIGVTGTPAAGATVTLDATGVPEGTVVNWDLDGDGDPGDGDPGDGEAITVDWTVPGDALVGAPLVVSAFAVAPDGSRDVATTIVEVADGGNQAPVVDGLDRTIRTLAPGDSELFEAVATDPDGDPLTYEWLLDGVEQDGETAATFTLVTGADDYGDHLVELVVSDGQAVTRTMWYARILTPDTDRDGWRAAPGPDCLDVPDDSGVSPFFVNPARPEVANNGTDDDCRDDTPDDGSGSVGSVSLSGIGPTRVGDNLSPNLSWNHPNKYNSGLTFELSVDWGDGSPPTVETVPGTQHPDNEFTRPVHRYQRAFDRVEIRACVTLVETGYEFCSANSATTVVNTAPLVNAADLRTFAPLDSGIDDFRPLDPRDWEPLDPDGRSVISVGNPNSQVILPSGVDLAEDGYGRVTLHHEVLGSGDDDVIGLALGYQPGEVVTDDADFVVVSWANAPLPGSQPLISSLCNDAPEGVRIPLSEAFQAIRQQGLAAGLEVGGATTFDIPYDPSDDAAEGEPPQDPRCSDDAGATLLGAVDRTAGIEAASVWRKRAASLLQMGSPGWAQQPHVIEYDYQPDSLRVWVNGVLSLDVTSADPLPPGGVGLLYGSQAGARASVTAPQPTFQFVQGKGGELSDEEPDGITMPMIDGWSEEHTVRIDWGDGSATTVGQLTQDPATGGGWFTITGDHVYEQAGDFEGEVCVTDDGGLRSCFPFFAEVANLPPVVDPGPDRATGPAVELTDVTFQDPGVADTHTATVDWDVDDGEGPVAVGVDEIRGGGTIDASHTYPSDGERTVEICVTDQLGATGCAEKVLDVVLENDAPVALVEEDAAGAEGAEVGVGVGFTDTGPDDTHTVTIDWGDGSDPEAVTIQDGGVFGSGQGTHVYVEDGVYEVVVEVCDDQDACDTATADVAIANAAPEVGEVVVADARARILEVQAAFTDPGTADTHTATVDWGDGSGPQPATVEASEGAGTVSATHPYTTADRFTVEVCVTDDDGDTGCASGEAVTDVPSPPLDVSAIGGDGNATVRWEVPLDDGGSPILDYEVETTPGGATETTAGPVLEHVVAGLANGVDHTFRVRARNAVGFSDWSLPSNAARPRPACVGDAFPDVPTDHPFCPEIQWMADNGVSTGFADGTYKPVRDITRQAMAAFVYRLANPASTPPACTVRPFPDVAVDHPFCAEITWMKAEGITTGFPDGSYRPAAPVSRQAVAAMLYRLTGSPRGDDPGCERDEFTDVTMAHPFCGEIDWMVDNGIAAGFPAGDFRPTNPITRQAMAAFIFRYNVLVDLL